MSEEAAIASAPESGAPASPPADAGEEIARLEAEAGIANGPLAARLFVQAGRLFQDAKHDAGEAKRCFSTALERDPAYRPALDALRRLHAETGEWAEVAKLYEKELPFAKDDAARFEILRAQAAVCARRLGDEARARALFVEASKLAPGHPMLLEAAIAEAAAKGDAKGEFDLRVRLARSLRDERLKARQLSRAALVAEKAGQLDAARLLRQELLAIAPLDLDAQASALPKILAEKDISSLEQTARAELEASSASAARVRLARLLAPRPDDREEALELLQSAREINPRDGAALEALIDFSAETGDEAAYEANLAARAESARDALDKANAALRLARQLEKTGKAEEAQALFARVAELVPEHPEAVAARRANAKPRSAADELAETEAALPAETEPAKKAELACLAGLLLEELGRDAEAAARYLDALGFSPSHLGARNALVALHARAGRWQELAQFHEKEYLIAADEAHKREALVEMAELLETRLGDVASAQAAYRMALELAADATVARALVRCAEATNKPRDLAFGLEKEAECTDAPRRRATLLHRAADVYARELKRPKEAVRLYETLLAEQEGYGPARRGLELVRREHPELAPKEEASTVGEADVAAGRALAARAWDEAAKAFADIVAANARHPTAWLDLSRAAEGRGDFATAVDALEHHAALVTDGLAKADVLVRAAELAEEKLAEPGRAEKLANEASEAAPRNLSAWQLVARLALARGDVARAVASLEQQVQVSQLKDRTTASRRLASLLADRVGDRERAILLYRQIVDDDASDLWAIAELERLYRETGDLAKSAELRSRFAARCSDIRAAALLRTSAAEDRAATGDEEGAVNEYRRALAVDGRIRTALDEVLLALRKKGDRAGLVDLYQRMAPYLDNDSQAFLALMRGELHDAQGQTALALKAYRDAVALDQTLLPALREARRLHEAAGEWNEARSLLAQEGEAHPDRAEGVRLVVRAGELAESRAGDREQAEAHYLRALELKPGEAQALERLSSLLGGQERFAELVTILEREAEAVSDVPPQSARLYAESAWLRFEKLGEDRRAAVPLNRALARDASCKRALELKAKMALASSNAGDAIEALRTALAAPGADVAKLQAQLAEALVAANRAAEALVAARAAFGADTSEQNLELVARTASAAGEHEFAAVTFERLADASAADPERARAFLARAAEIWEKAGDALRAADVYRRALDANPKNAALHVALARTLARAPATRARAAAELRALVAKSPLEAEAWRALHLLFAEDNRRDAAFVALAMLVGAGGATAEERARWAQDAAKLPPGPQVAPTADDLVQLVHPNEASSPLRELFNALAPVLPKIVPGSIERHGLGRGDRVKNELRQVADRFSKLFGAGDFELYVTTRAPLEAWVENTDPPSLVVGAGIQTDGVGELLFTLGMLVGRIRMRTQAAYFARPIEIANLTAEALRQVDSSFSRFGTKSPELAQLVSRAVGRSEKKAIEAVAPKFAGPVNFGLFTQAMAFTSHRFGLVAAADPAAALRVLTRAEAGQPPPAERAEVRELASFAVSEEHLNLRARLRIALA